MAPPNIANVCKFSHIGKQESDGATGPSHQWPKYHQLKGCHLATGSLQTFLLVVGCLLNSRKFWCSGLLLSAFFSGNWTERRETSSKSCPSGLLCVEGCHPFHHWWMANEEANDESCKRTCDLTPSDMARWLSHKPPMPTWHDNITWHDFISSHFILSLRGVSKCVFDRNLMLVTCFYRFLFINQVSPYGMKNQSWEYPVYTHISECGEWWDETYFHILPLIMGFPL